MTIKMTRRDKAMFSLGGLAADLVSILRSVNCGVFTGEGWEGISYDMATLLFHGLKMEGVVEDNEVEA